MRRIVDRYLACGRLRVRMLTDLDSGKVAYKLTKKYAEPAPPAQPITTLYLTAEEHAALAALPGRDLVKRRHFVREGELIFGVDAFEGTLTGLVTCEIEVDTAAELAAVTPPAWTLREVTHDPFFSGGHLASVDRATLITRLP